MASRCKRRSEAMKLGEALVPEAFAEALHDGVDRERAGFAANGELAALGGDRFETNVAEGSHQVLVASKRRSLTVP